jgi:hypothetical protein
VFIYMYNGVSIISTRFSTKLDYPRLIPVTQKLLSCYSWVTLRLGYPRIRFYHSFDFCRPNSTDNRDSTVLILSNLITQFSEVKKCLMRGFVFRGGSAIILQTNIEWVLLHFHKQSYVIKIVLNVIKCQKLRK